MNSLATVKAPHTGIKHAYRRISVWFHINILLGFPRRLPATELYLSYHQSRAFASQKEILISLLFSPSF